MIPIDGRKYKEHTIKEVIDKHTFKPKINDKYGKVVELRYAKMREKMQEDFRSLDRNKIFEQGAESSRARRAFLFDEEGKGGLNQPGIDASGSISIPLDSNVRRKNLDGNAVDPSLNPKQPFSP